MFYFSYPVVIIGILNVFITLAIVIKVRLLRREEQKKYPNSDICCHPDIYIIGLFLVFSLIAFILLLSFRSYCLIDDTDESDLMLESNLMFIGIMFGSFALVTSFFSFAVYYEHHEDVLRWDKEKKEQQQRWDREERVRQQQLTNQLILYQNNPQNHFILYQNNPQNHFILYQNNPQNHFILYQNNPQNQLRLYQNNPRNLIYFSKYL